MRPRARDMRAIDKAREFERLDAASGATSHAVIVAERAARGRGIVEKNLNRDAAVQTATAAHRAAINAQVEFTFSHDLDFFGAPKRPGTGIYGEISIAQIPRQERGR
jgi:hypothetical protein